MLPDYMEKQTDISGDMRAILVDWMVEVQVRGHSFLQSFLSFPMLPLARVTSVCWQRLLQAFPAQS